MKKVLIIAHLFHASPRIPGLAKYLPEFGWQPVILTTPIGEDSDSQFGPPKNFKNTNRVIETFGYSSPYGKKRLTSKKYSRIRPFLKFLYKYYREIAQYPDAEKGWKPFALKAGDELLQNEDIGVILSCSSPVTCHLIAKELKERHKIPWVADMRDLWTQNHNYPYSPLRKVFEKRLELKTLSTADALVTTSEPLAGELSSLHKREVYTITNGFDPEIVSNGKASLTSEFTITYTGQIYKRQDPTKLLLALKDLISEGTINPKELKVRFYGPENETLLKETKKYGLSEIVKQYGVVPRESSFEKQRESQLLLQINWEDPRKRGIYSGKIFEYLAAQRPIIATGDNDTIEKLLNETSSGIYCPTKEDIKNALRQSYSEYKSKGKVAYHGNIEKSNKYSYREMAKKFAGILGTVQRKVSSL